MSPEVFTFAFCCVKTKYLHETRERKNSLNISNVISSTCHVHFVNVISFIASAAGSVVVS